MALKNALAADAVADPIDLKPVKIKGLETLIFWGHGSHTGLCGKVASEIIKLIDKWKDKNSDLKRVEIITCNSRHFDDNWLAGTKPAKYWQSQLMHLGANDRINDSIAKQIKRGMKYSVYPSIRKIKIMSMPESGRGNYKQYSILYWDLATTSWCYVTGGSEADMFEIGNNIKMTKSTGTDPQILWGKPRVGDFPTKLAAAKLDFPAGDYADVEAGDLTVLRNILVEVG